MRYRRIAVGLAVVAIALMLVSTGGFSSIYEDRDVYIPVVGDSTATVGYESPESIVVNGNWSNPNATVATDADLVTITNRGNTPLEIVEVSVSASTGINVEDVSAPEVIESHKQESIDATIRCTTQATTADVEVSVTVRSNEFSAILHGDGRTITVTCPS